MILVTSLRVLSMIISCTTGSRQLTHFSILGSTYALVTRYVNMYHWDRERIREHR